MSNDFPNLRVQEMLWKFIRHTISWIGEESSVKEKIMMDQIFDWCVNVLVYWAGILGITYKAINVWVFVILWPILTIILIGVIVVQRRMINQLSRDQREQP